MEKLKIQIDINAPALKVYEMMLGLNQKSTYEYWTTSFNPTSTYEGNWEKGSKILFIGFDENGNKGGMVAEVMDNQPGKYVSVRHYGILDGENEITTGEKVEQWAGGYEIYHFEEKNGMTTVTVELEIIEEYIDYFKEAYPNGLDKLKEMCENKILH